MNLKKIAFAVLMTTLISNAWADDALDAAVAAASEAVEAANGNTTSSETPATDDTSTDTTTVDAPEIDEAAE